MGVATELIPDVTTEYKKLAASARNLNKIVTITRNSTGTTWRNALSTVVKGYSNAKGFIFGDGIDLDKLDVDPNIELLMEDDLSSLGFSINFETPVGDFLNKVTSIPLGGSGLDVGELLNLVGGVAGAIKNGVNGNTSTLTAAGFDPWVKNIPAYDTGTAETLNIDYTFKFRLGQYGLWNAEEEVVKPIINLVAPVLPQHLNAFTLNGPFPSSVNLVTNLISQVFDEDLRKQWSQNMSEEVVGTNFNSVKDFFSAPVESIGAVLEAVLLGAYQSFTYDVTFGNTLSLKNSIIGKAEVNFSKDTDQNGNPVSGSVRLSFGCIVPTSITSSTANNLGVRFGRRN